MDKPLEVRMTEVEKEIAELKEQVSKQPEEMKSLILHCYGIAHLRLQQHLEHYNPKATPNVGDTTCSQ
ncbi:MAG: hypothetical protein ACM3KR_01140 [Deltaproteobacteria bacterium]